MQAFIVAKNIAFVVIEEDEFILVCKGFRDKKIIQNILATCVLPGGK